MTILIWVNYLFKWSMCYSWIVAQPSTSLNPVCSSATLTNLSSLPVNNPYSPPNSPPGRSHPRVCLFILPAGFNQFLSMCSIYLPPSNTDPQPWREIRWKRCITGLQSWILLYFLPLFFWQAIKTSVSPASSLRVWEGNYFGGIWRLHLHNEGSGMWLNTAGWGSGEVVISQQLSL